MHTATRRLSPPRSRIQQVMEQLVAERNALQRAAESSDARSRALSAELTRLRQALGHLKSEHKAALVARDEAIRQYQEVVAAQPDPPSEPVVPVDTTALEHRLVADLANLRRNQDQAIERVRGEERAQSAEAIGRLRDDLERALASSPDTDTPWAEGTRLVLRTAEGSLARLGAASIGEAGETFSPELHEAIGQAPGGKMGTIASVKQRGILLQGGRLVRPARVIVHTGYADA